MSLSTYLLFSVIAEYENMTKAAEALHMTPSAASHAINSLERSFGFPLVYRDRNGTKLTAEGALLLPQIREILSQEAHLQEYVSYIKGLDRGSVNVGVIDSVCRAWLPAILHQFKEKYPNVEVRIYQDGYQAIEKMLFENMLDVGFLSLPTSDKLSTITLAHDRLLCITPTAYTPQNSKSGTLNDLKTMNLVLPRRGYDRITEEFLRENHLEQNSTFFINLDHSVIALVENNVCCSIIPELVLRHCVGNYNIFPLESNLYRTIAVAYLKGRELSLATKKMILEIQNCVQSFSNLC